MLLLKKVAKSTESFPSVILMGIFALLVPQIPTLEWRGHAWGQVNLMPWWRFKFTSIISSKASLILNVSSSRSCLNQSSTSLVWGGDSFILLASSLLIMPSVWQPCFIVCCSDEGKYVKPTSNSSKTSKNRLQKSVRSSHSPSSSPHLSEGRRDKHSRSRSPQSSRYVRRYVEM